MFPTGVSPSFLSGGASRRIVVWCAWLLAAVVATMNVLLVRENSALKSRANRPPGAVAESVPDLTGVGLDGRIVHVPFEQGHRILVFTFSSGCRFCKSSLGDWRALARGLDGTKWTVVWVSPEPLDAVQPFVTAENLQGTILTDVPHRVYVQLGLAAVPQTIALSEDGTVLGSVSGALTPAKIDQVSRLVLGPSNSHDSKH